MIKPNFFLVPGDFACCPLFSLGHRGTNDPVFRIRPGKKEKWEESLRKEGFSIIDEGESFITHETYMGNYTDCLDKEMIRIEVSPALSGHAFRRIGLKHGVIEPMNKRDHKYLARLERESTMFCPSCGTPLTSVENWFNKCPGCGDSLG